MTRKIPYMTSIIAVIAVSMVFGASIAATGGFLDIKKATIKIDDDEFEKAQAKTDDKIPTDGSGGAFGYGIITDAGLEAILVTTTHGGVKDSEAQSDASDPVFHNHYVALQDSQTAGSGLCPELEVRDISFEQPGEVEVKGKKAEIEGAPFSFSGTHSLTGDPVSFAADANVGAVVSFTINPVDSDGNTSVTDIAAVCINDVQAADKLKVK